MMSVRVYDLRHNFVIVAVAGGDSLYLVGEVLGHPQSRTTEGHVPLANDPLLAVADRVAERISAAMGSAGDGRGAVAGAVVALQKARLPCSTWS